MEHLSTFFKGILAILLFGQSFFAVGQGATCAAADPFCTSTVYSFPNNTGVADAETTEPGNNYGCLDTSPNPAWYYMEVGTSGNLIFDITQTSGAGSGLDVDFILYGPYTDLTEAISYCGNHGNASTAADPNQVVDCSYDPAPQETVTINSATAGDVYMILITNFSNEAGTITFQQTGGSGSTNCSIVVPACPTIGIHAEVGASSYAFPISLDCNVSGWLTIREDDPTTAGGAIAPSIIVDIQPTNGNATGNNIYGYENTPPWSNFWSATNIPAASNYTFTMLEVDNVAPTSLGVELCDVTAGTNMSYTITDGACGTVLSTGTWTAGGGAAGPNGPPSSGGCQFITIPVGSVSGSATYSCPTCPPGSFQTTDYGRAFFNPSIAGPGSYNVEYCWDNE
ncbi:MAG: hypothetical protein JKY30_13960 [Flavobacteriales bacterium]|nr:hypothetical protein [Flavobacteriales bacterium]